MHEVTSIYTLIWTSFLDVVVFLIIKMAVFIFLIHIRRTIDTSARERERYQAVIYSEETKHRISHLEDQLMKSSTIFLDELFLWCIKVLIMKQVIHLLRTCPESL